MFHVPTSNITEHSQKKNRKNKDSKKQMIHRGTQYQNGRRRRISGTVHPPTFLCLHTVVLVVVVVVVMGGWSGHYPNDKTQFSCHALTSSWIQKSPISTSFVSLTSSSSSSSSSCPHKHTHDNNHYKTTIPYQSRIISNRDYAFYRNAVVRDDVMTEYVDNSPKPKVVFADYMAQCVPGMAHILADELKMLGGQHIELSGTSAVCFRVDYHQPAIILNILLWCRTAQKIMELLCRTNEPIYTRKDLYEWIRNTIPTTDLLLNPTINANGKHSWFTLSVAVTLNNAKFIPPDINHSHYTALNIKNALVDAAREISENDTIHHLKNSFEADRPSVDITESCDVPLMVMVRGIPSDTTFPMSYNNHNYPNNNNNHQNKNYNYNDRSRNVEVPPSSGGAQISLFRCIHGIGSLHRRGYRADMQIHKAAMKESTAAALLYAAQWHIKCQQNDGAVLMDPMMGSGTLLIEGAMMAADIAPGLMRIKCGIPYSQSPPILRWKMDSNSENDDTTTATTSDASESIQSIWNQLLMDATKRAQRGIGSLRERNIHILGNDINDRAYLLADASFQQAGLRNVVQLDCTDCAHWKPSIDSSSAEWNHSENQPVKTLPWMIVSNPPWGVRLSEDMDVSWEALRTFLRSDSSIVPKSNDDTNQSEAWILSGNANATKHLGLRRSQSVPFQTGDQTLRWLQYILRPPGTMNTTSYSNSADGYKKKITPENIPRFKYQDGNPFAAANADRVPYERQGQNRNFESQNQNHYRPTNNQFSDDRNFRVHSSSNRNGSTSDRRGGRRQNFDSSPMEQGRQQQQQRRRDQPPKPRKAKASVPPKDSENEWLI